MIFPRAYQAASLTVCCLDFCKVTSRCSRMAYERASVDSDSGGVDACVGVDKGPEVERTVAVGIATAEVVEVCEGFSGADGAVSFSRRSSMSSAAE